MLKIISAIVSLFLGVAVAVLIMILRQYFPNGYTTRVEFAIVAGLLFFLTSLSMLLIAILSGELLKQIRRNLYDPEGQPLFVRTVTLKDQVSEIIQAQKREDDYKKQIEARDQEDAAMRRLDFMQRELKENGYPSFGNPDKQKEYEDLTTKYGEKLAAEKAALSKPTTMSDPVRVFDPNRKSPARPPSA